MMVLCKCFNTFAERNELADIYNYLSVSNVG